MVAMFIKLHVLASIDMSPDQKEHWDRTYADNPVFFGSEPSFIARRAMEVMKKEGCRDVLELGPGQGRDTVHLAVAGYNISAVDYSPVSCRQLSDACDNVEAVCCDMRRGLPFPDRHFDACFSHMFFTMSFRSWELEEMMCEIYRVLRPGGLVFYSVRNHKDPHFRKGNHVAEEIWENNGFEVRYFCEYDIRRLAQRFDLVSIEEFEEGELPRRLYAVTMRRPSR